MIMRNEGRVSEDGRTATLEKSGKTLTARLLSPVDGDVPHNGRDHEKRRREPERGV